MNCTRPGFPVFHLSPGVCPNSCPPSRWCHPTISSSVVPFSACPQPFTASLCVAEVVPLVITLSHSGPDRFEVAYKSTQWMKDKQTAQGAEPVSPQAVFVQNGAPFSRRWSITPGHRAWGWSPGWTSVPPTTGSLSWVPWTQPPQPRGLWPYKGTRLKRLMGEEIEKPRGRKAYRCTIWTVPYTIQKWAMLYPQMAKSEMKGWSFTRIMVSTRLKQTT